MDNTRNSKEMTNEILTFRATTNKRQEKKPPSIQEREKKPPSIQEREKKPSSIQERESDNSYWMFS